MVHFFGVCVCVGVGGFIREEELLNCCSVRGIKHFRLCGNWKIMSEYFTLFYTLFIDFLRVVSVLSSAQG